MRASDEPTTRSWRTRAPGARARLSFVLEWANTRLHGASRASRLLDALVRQWQEIAAGAYPSTLPAAAARFLDGLDERAELLIVSGERLDGDREAELRALVEGVLDCAIHVAEGLEYYPLKSFGAARASGDVLLFVDSDVLPEEGWLAHLLGSFARPDIDVVTGQTYVAPTGVVGRAFALGWTYELRDRSGRLLRNPAKVYANNIAFRAEVFRRVDFRAVGRRSRGAVTLLRRDLDRLGVPIWENRMARVDHPPPTSVRHMVVRALAHGRDHYMRDSERRAMAGLARSVGVAAQRLARGLARTARYRREVGASWRQVPLIASVIAAYYVVFAVGGVLTHVSPAAMARRFRV